MPGPPVVSVVVVPREGFSQAPFCLETLIATTTEPAWRLVYVDGNAPRSVAMQLAAKVRAVDGTLIRANRFLRPTSARILGLAEVTTPYVLFLDNDVIVTPGWLAALLNAAEESRAAYVSPVVCQGNRSPRIVHFGGGANTIAVADDGMRSLIERYDHGAEPLGAVNLAPGPTAMAEMHCVLVRRSALEASGGLDERLSTAFEHNDLCLRLADHGGGWFEPGATVDNLQDAGARRGDRAYHQLRWSRGWLTESRDAFCAKYAIPATDPAIQRDLRGLHQRRRAPTGRMRRLARRFGGKFAVGLHDAALDLYIERVLRPTHERRPARLTYERPSNH